MIKDVDAYRESVTERYLLATFGLRDLRRAVALHWIVKVSEWAAILLFSVQVVLVAYLVYTASPVRGSQP